MPIIIRKSNSLASQRNRYKGKSRRQSEAGGSYSPGRRSPKKGKILKMKKAEGPGWFTGFWISIKLVMSGVFLLTLLASLSVGLVLGYHYLINHPYFLVRKVVLSGLDRVPRALVLKRAGLDKSVNILALRLGEMGVQLRGIPWVKDVTLTRKLPDTIKIDIFEYKPRTLINLGSLYYLDTSGHPFKKVDPQEKPELPIVTGFTWDDFAKRKEYAIQDLKEIFALLDVLAGRNDRFRPENISEINFDAARGLSIFTRDDNLQLKIGFGEYRAKLKRLGRVMAHLKITGQSDGLVYFNLENSPRVIVRHAAQS